MIKIQQMIKDSENQEFRHIEYNPIKEYEDIEFKECKICGMQFFK